MAQTVDPVSAFSRKWAGQPLDSSPSGVLQNIDLRRLKAGKAPLTASQTQRAVQAATTREPVTPVPEDHDPWAVWSNITRDITDLVKGIPQLPMALVNEARQLPTLPLKMSQARDLGSLAQLPGVRLVPGAFTASALLPGGVPAGTILERPVSTVLDVLPYANKLAEVNAARALSTYSGTPAAALPDLASPVSADLAKAAIARAGSASELPVADRLGLQASLALGENRRLFPDMAMNRLVRDIRPETASRIDLIERRPVLEEFRRTPTGQRAFQMGEKAREFVSGIRRTEATSITKDMPEDIPVKFAGEQLYLDMQQAADEGRLGMPIEQADDLLHRAITDPLSMPDPVLTPAEARAQLPDSLHPYFDTYIDELLPEMQRSSMSDFGGTARRDPFVAEYRGDIYTRSTANRLARADERIVNAAGKLTDLKPTPRFLNRLAAQTKVPDPQLLLDAAYQIPDAADRYAFLRDSLGSDTAARKFAEYGQLMDDRAAALKLPPDATPAEILESLANSTPHKRVSAGLMSNKEFTSYSQPIIELRAAAKARMHMDDLSARYSETGKRLYYEKARANYDRAQTLPPELRQEYLAITDLPSNSLERRAALAEFRNRIGDENYRLVQYTRPDVDALATPFSDNTWRQGIRGFVDAREVARLQREVKAELNGLRSNGYEPAYVPGVAAERVGKIDSSTVKASYSNPDFAKERTFDYAPQDNNLGISVAYQTMQDWMARKAEPFMAEQVAMYGKSGADLLYQLEAQGIEAARRLRLSPEESGAFVNDFMNHVKQRGWVQYKPEEIFPTAEGLRNPATDFREQIFLPREYDSLVRKMVNDQTSYFQKMFDPVSKTFRTSVLLFSPAWHYNNILSGALITAVTNPSAFLHMAEEWNRRGGWGRMLSRDGLDAIVPTEAQARVHFEGMTGNLENTMITLSKERGRLENSLARTQTVSRLWNEVQQSKLARGIVNGFNRTTDFSLNLNAFWDDMFRAANFDAFEASTRKMLIESGVPAEKAAQIAAERALAKTQTIFMDWTQFLPVERGILRAVFPFYAWTSHIMRLAFKLPFDHPLRVAVINNFTRAEIEDWQSGYPQIFRRILGFADPKTSDNFVGMNVDAFNPFRDIGNTLTMAGMVAATNPIIQQVFKSVGVDPMSGGPEYAPHFVYDATEPSGQALDTGNPIIDLAGSIVPQARAIARWAGMDEQFRQLEASNPAAAHRALLSGLRLPIIYRDVNVPEALALEEVKRFNAFRKAVSEAKDGNVGQLRRFDPVMAEQIMAAQSSDSGGGSSAPAAASPLLPPVPASNPLVAVGRSQMAAAGRVRGKAPLLPAAQFVTV